MYFSQLFLTSKCEGEENNKKQVYLQLWIVYVIV